ncbi:DUF427 domain-containing protein [soil metagenome]
MAVARLHGTVIADSDDTVVVEGNHYFPADSVRSDLLADTDLTTLCPWKGVAHYKTATVDGTDHADVAWYYLKPSMLARRIKGRIAFDRRVDVEA